jgi:hypothetical protein
MTTNPAERGPHDPEHTPVTPGPDVVATDMPGVDPDWPQTVAPEETVGLGEDPGTIGNESVEG